MCRWLTYCGEPIYLDKVLFEPQYSLINQSLHARHSHVTTNGDGFGVGWYGERGVPGVRRVVLAGCGHAPHRERPDETTAAVTALAHEVCATGASR